MSRRAQKFEDCFRIYSEIEDIGKTVKASKRRARWTFSFGEQGHEKEVILIHSVMSGKKSILYDGREIHRSDEYSRTFQYSWYDGEHILRVDILDIVEVGTRNDKMYDLTLDGVPFHVLPIKPVSLPKLATSGRSNATSTSSSRNAGQSSSLRESAVIDDFDPRGNNKVKAIGNATAPSPPVDFLGGDSSFDTFSSAAAAGNIQQKKKDDLFGAPTGGFDAFFESAAPTNTTGVVKHDLAKEFSAGFNVGSSSQFSNFPTTTTTHAGMTANAGAVPLSSSLMNFNQSHPSASSSFPPQPTASSSLIYPNGSLKPDSSKFNDANSLALTKVGETDVDKATASLVNLNNLWDEGSSRSTSPGKAYRPAYTDNRSLEDIRASQVGKQKLPCQQPASSPAKPIFLERPQMSQPPRPTHSPQAYFGTPGFSPSQSSHAQAQALPMMMPQGPGPAYLQQPPMMNLTAQGPSAFYAPQQLAGFGFISPRPPPQPPQGGVTAIDQAFPSMGNRGPRGYGALPPRPFSHGGPPPPRPPPPGSSDPFYGL